MSKKIAAGADILLTTVGEGAFMKNIEDARVKHVPWLTGSGVGKPSLSLQI